MKELVGRVSPLIGETEHSRFGREQIAEMLLSAALQKQSIEFVSQKPTGDTVFLRLKAGLTVTNLREVIAMSRPIVKEPVRIAIDVHDVMYYGDRFQGIVGTRERAGSNFAFKYLVAKIVGSKHVYVVGLRELTDGRVTESTIEMLEELRKAYDISEILMDGGFPSSVLIEYLNGRGMHYVCRFRSTTTVRNADIRYNEPVHYSTVKKTRGDRPNTLAVDFFVYRYKGHKTDFYLISDRKEDAKSIRMEFKKRWGIETGFRDNNRVKIKTCTKNFLVRIFIYFLACLVYNLWVRIRAVIGIRLNELKIELLSYLKNILADSGLKIRWL